MRIRQASIFITLIILLSACWPQYNQETDNVSQIEELTSEEIYRLEVMTYLAYNDICDIKELHYFLRKKDSGISYSVNQKKLLYYAAYSCGIQVKDPEMIYKFGRALAFDLNFWPEGADCRALKFGAKQLGLIDEFLLEKEEKGLICFDDYRFDDL